MGYWKEVRESLGLAPLQDTFLWTSSLLRDTEGGRNVLGLLQGGTGHASNGRECLGQSSTAKADSLLKDMDASGSEHRLLRLGRFNPHLRRWGARRSMIKIPSSFGPFMDCIQPESQTQASQPDFESSSTTPGAASIAEHESEEQSFPDLFVSSTPDESNQGVPLLDVESLAASFRAVAAHELRGRSGLTHGARRRDRMFRHLMG